MTGFLKERFNEGINLVRTSNRRINVIRSSSNESSAHKLWKQIICFGLSMQNRDFICEAIFKKGGRADIFLPGEFKVIEIAVSETEESLIKKSKEYPKGLTIEVIRVGQSFAT